MYTITYENIDQSIRGADAEAMPAAANAQRVIATYQGVRPLLAALTTLPLLPPHWRESLRRFLAALDALAQSIAAEEGDPTFKAGKDL